MATFTDAQILNLLKIELNKPAAYVSDILELKIGAAKERIQKKGIKLDMSSYDDVELVVAYAAWLYRLKDENPDDTKMPRMLQIALHDRIIDAVGDRATMEVLTDA